MFESTIKRLFQRIRFQKEIFREAFAEFIGTFTLIVSINLFTYLFCLIYKELFETNNSINIK